MRHKLAILLTLFLGLTEVTNLQAQGTLEGVLPTDGLPVAGYMINGTIGWAFSSSQDIVISSLGWLSGHPEPNSTNAVLIGLWSTDGTLLRSVVIDDHSQVVNGSLYQSISPVFVSAGKTLVVAAGSSGEFITVILYHSPQYPVTYAGVAYKQPGGFDFPTWQPVSTETLIPAATFLFQPVPEPSTFGLFALGGLLLGVRRWRNSSR